MASKKLFNLTPDQAHTVLCGQGYADKARDLLEIAAADGDQFHNGLTIFTSNLGKSFDIWFAMYHSQSWCSCSR